MNQGPPSTLALPSTYPFSVLGLVLYLYLYLNLYLSFGRLGVTNKGPNNVTLPPSSLRPDVNSEAADFRVASEFLFERSRSICGNLWIRLLLRLRP